MTEITTFKGNWAEFPGEPTFMGRRLLKAERQRFDRACAFAQGFRDLCRGTGFDFNKKYLVVENYRHDRVIDYDEIAVQLEIAPFDEYPPYPDGGVLPEVVVYDAVGRKMETGFAGGAPAYQFDVPASGVYLVKIGDRPARRIVVIR